VNQDRTGFVDLNKGMFDIVKSGPFNGASIALSKTIGNCVWNGKMDEAAVEQVVKDLALGVITITAVFNPAIGLTLGVLWGFIQGLISPEKPDELFNSIVERIGVEINLNNIENELHELEKDAIDLQDSIDRLDRSPTNEQLPILKNSVYEQTKRLGLDLRSSKHLSEEEWAFNMFSLVLEIERSEMALMLEEHPEWPAPEMRKKTVEVWVTDKWSYHKAWLLMRRPAMKRAKEIWLSKMDWRIEERDINWFLGGLECWSELKYQSNTYKGMNIAETMGCRLVTHYCDLPVFTQHCNTCWLRKPEDICNPIHISKFYDEYVSRDGFGQQEQKHYDLLKPFLQEEGLPFEVPTQQQVWSGDTIYLKSKRFNKWVSCGWDKNGDHACSASYFHDYWSGAWHKQDRAITIYNPTNGGHIMNGQVVWLKSRNSNFLRCVNNDYKCESGATCPSSPEQRQDEETSSGCWGERFRIYNSQNHGIIQGGDTVWLKLQKHEWLYCDEKYCDAKATCPGDASKRAITEDTGCWGERFILEKPDQY